MHVPRRSTTNGCSTCPYMYIYIYIHTHTHTCMYHAGQQPMDAQVAHRRIRRVQSQSALPRYTQTQFPGQDLCIYTYIHIHIHIHIRSPTLYANPFPGQDLCIKNHLSFKCLCVCMFVYIYRSSLT